MSCVCSVCGRPIDCGDTICGICECSDGEHCERIVREIEPNLFVVQQEDGSYTLKWIP